MAVQVRNDSKHFSIFSRFDAVLAHRLCAAGPSGMGFEFASFDIGPVALVVRGLVVRQTRESRHEDKRPAETVDIATTIRTHLRSSGVNFRRCWGLHGLR